MRDLCAHMSLASLVQSFPAIGKLSTRSFEWSCNTVTPLFFRSKTRENQPVMLTNCGTGSGNMRCLVGTEEAANDSAEETRVKMVAVYAC